MTGTGLGSGYVPLAPGTAGSLVGLLIYFILPMEHTLWLGITIVITVVGIPVAAEIEKEYGHDPGLVVIDEICGQWITLLFLPRSFPIFVLAFVLFRIFDIWKPYPVSRSQKLKGGLGIMLDDVLAGIMGNIVLHLLLAAGLPL